MATTINKLRILIARAIFQRFALFAATPRANSILWQKWSVALLFGVLVAAVSAPSAQAHPSHDDYLQVLTEQIAEQPSDPLLYIRRADLKREHGDTMGAMADLDRAANIDPTLALVDLARAQAYLAIGDAGLAHFHLQRSLRAHPENAKALLAYARTLVRLGSFDEAADYYQRAIEQLKTATPDHYLEWAGAWQSAQQPRRALKAIDTGLQRLGSLTSLQSLAIDIAVGEGWFDEALERLTVLSNASSRKSKWLLRKGEVLEAAGRTADALSTYQQARNQLDKALAQHPNRRPLLELDQMLTATLTRLQPGSAPEGKAQ